MKMKKSEMIDHILELREENPKPIKSAKKEL